MYIEKTPIVVAYFFQTVDERRQFVAACKNSGLAIFSQATIFIRHQPKSKRFKVVLDRDEIKRKHIKLSELEGKVNKRG